MGKGLLTQLTGKVRHVASPIAESRAEAVCRRFHVGMPPMRDPAKGADKVRDLKEKGLGASEIAKALKIGRASVYRALLSVP
jgi:DNA invertase Pin-like site-specific DNA recombinase